MFGRKDCYYFSLIVHEEVEDEKKKKKEEKRKKRMMEREEKIKKDRVKRITIRWIEVLIIMINVEI